MDVFTKQPLVARKHAVEDSEDINTEYLLGFFSSRGSRTLPAGLRSQCWIKGWFLTDISRNTFILEIKVREHNQVDNTLTSSLQGTLTW